MLFIIGLGLSDENDITLKEKLYSKDIIIADRELVEGEGGVDGILDGAKNENVAFLVVGDPYSATTHSDLVSRAREMGVKVQVIHNASIMNAVGCCGLQLYNYGQTVSICFWTDSWRPDSFYDKIKINNLYGLHTLCLLDIKVKEQSIENMARNRKIFDPSRFMTVNTAVSQLLEIESNRNEGICTINSIAVGLARVGAVDEKIVVGTLGELKDIEFGGPLHSMVIVGKMHFMERESLRAFAVCGETFDKYAQMHE